MSSCEFWQIVKNSFFAEQLWRKEDASVAECLEDSTTFGKAPYFLVGDWGIALCSLGCLDYILAKEYPKNKEFAIIDYLGHVR